MVSEERTFTPDIYRCVYCNATVDSKKKVGKNSSLRKRAGVRHFVDLFVEKFKQESMEYTASFPRVYCGVEKINYDVFCNNPKQCKEVFASINPLRANPSKKQELKTRISRIDQKDRDTGLIESITFHEEQDMYNVIFEKFILVVSDNGVDEHEKRFMLEDIHDRNKKESENWWKMVE